MRIGSWAGFWGDSGAAAKQVLAADLDYLVGDHLAEITMALLARARAKDPEAGFIPDVVATLTPLLGELGRTKVITNGGGLNPAACAAALQAAADEQGLSLKVAAVIGDDVSAARDPDAVDMFTGQPVPEHVLTMNAYLGARPIAEALRLGADIVVTGRCADSAVVLGPLLHEFGWADDEYDKLSAGSLLGHLVECGPQGVGGLFTDWADVPGWEDIGYPVIDVEADGSAVITKPAGTGGLVTPATVAEQLLYEIGDPGAYVLPDVVCDWREVRLEDLGDDRVRVTGARGLPPTTTYKATTTSLDGWRSIATMLFAGMDAPGRARRAGEAILARAERLAGTPFAATSVEVVGDAASGGAVVKLAARDPERDGLTILGRELASLALVAQGMTGFFAGRPKPAPVIVLTHVLVDKVGVPAQVVMGGEAHDVAVAPGSTAAVTPSPEVEPVTVADTDRVTVPLRDIAHGRSGDKGNHANIGLRARRPELFDVMVEQVTPARVAEVFAAELEGAVHVWPLPGIDAVNFLLEEVLGGQGGTSSLRFDPQGKSYAARLLALEVQVPAALVS